MVLLCGVACAIAERAICCNEPPEKININIQNKITRIAKKLLLCSTIKPLKNTFLLLAAFSLFRIFCVAQKIAVEVS